MAYDCDPWGPWCPSWPPQTLAMCPVQARSGPVSGLAMCSICQVMLCQDMVGDTGHTLVTPVTGTWSDVLLFAVSNVSCVLLQHVKRPGHDIIPAGTRSHLSHLWMSQAHDITCSLHFSSSALSFKYKQKKKTYLLLLWSVHVLVAGISSYHKLSAI